MAAPTHTPIVFWAVLESGDAIGHCPWPTAYPTAQAAKDAVQAACEEQAEEFESGPIGRMVWHDASDTTGMFASEATCEETETDFVLTRTVLG